MAIASINPATGELTKRFDPHTDAEIESALDRAVSAFEKYRASSFAERGARLRHAAEMLEKDRQHLARIITSEMGKLLRGSIDEIEKCARGCRFYADHGEKFLSEQIVSSDARRSYVRYDPLGAVLAIMPWNFPFWQVFRFAAPALMAGNAGLLKHASNVPQCALAIEDIFHRAGFPEGVFQTLLIGSDRVNNVIADPRVAAVTLTGSVGAGRSVAAAAGKQIKKSVLELGGSDPFIVMPSADLDRAAQTAAQARTINNGQSCIAAKRFIVHQSIAEQFEKKFVSAMASLKVGDPMDADTAVGPLATAAVLQELENQVSKTVEMGARVLLGGKRLDCKGNFFAPTVLADIPKGSPAFADELFGPVASLYRARDMAEAIEIANDSIFGLGACAWTSDPAERELFINEIQSGLAFINGMVASDPRIPFGGVKHSGFGRELSYHGIREFVNIKSVSIHDQEQ